MSLLPLSPAAERTKALQGKVELFLHSLSQAICPSFAIPINDLFLIMYYQYKPRIKIKNGAITVGYKSLTSQAFSKPVTEQQSLFDSEQYKTDEFDEDSDKYVF